jgi:hypothetical protein
MLILCVVRLLGGQSLSDLAWSGVEMLAVERCSRLVILSFIGAREGERLARVHLCTTA